MECQREVLELYNVENLDLVSFLGMQTCDRSPSQLAPIASAPRINRKHSKPPAQVGNLVGKS